MGDLTYDPNEPRRPRPIASPFGVMPTPGFNVVDPQAAQAPSLMSSLWASLPSREDWKQGTAETLGAPLDGLAWLLHRMGLPISGGEFYGGGTFNRAPGSGQPTWTPSASVPLSSQNIRGMIDNPPSLDLLLHAARRPGLF